MTRRSGVTRPRARNRAPIPWRPAAPLEPASHAVYRSHGHIHAASPSRAVTHRGVGMRSLAKGCYGALQTGAVAAHVLSVEPSIVVSRTRACCSLCALDGKEKQRRTPRTLASRMVIGISPSWGRLPRALCRPPDATVKLTTTRPTVPQDDGLEPGHDGSILGVGQPDHAQLDNTFANVIERLWH
jgi:hypothetical protein